ncbi:hypothetical protein ACQPYH_15265 [Kribbella sp. CA-245084]|uniref:hypothetical protein n=1 Tax=Kribbella sp. CA-245084 TaxID=3239940 RepID=UPI003D8F0D80
MNTETPTSATGTDDRSWPVLKAALTEPCDGCNPITGRPCTLGHHSGYHRDSSGTEWLDE